MVVKSNGYRSTFISHHSRGIASWGINIFGAPEVILWGVVSCFATVIPVIGVAIVWIPLALYIGAYRTLVDGFGFIGLLYCNRSECR